jgi:GT2 family glycosyltransferase
VNPRVLVSVVTFNSARHLAACLKSLEAQTYRNLEIRLWDNASRDGSLEVAAGCGSICSIESSTKNIGFCAAHNRILSSTQSDYALVLNPDVELAADYIGILVEALEQDPSAGSATGKLCRWYPGGPGSKAGNGKVILDTTGMYFTTNQRHLDRGAGEADCGQYERREYVFGPSGAAAFYRRAMLEDIRVGVEYFDESFFAYREDADLAWRAQWMGWPCLYVPEARGRHVRRVLPERRAQLPPEINMHSFKNRFLLRIKNMDPGTYLRFLLPITLRDMAALGYVLVREPSSLRAFPLLLRALPQAFEARSSLRKRRRTSPREVRAWFSDRPFSKSIREGGQSPVSPGRGHW